MLNRNQICCKFSHFLLHGNGSGASSVLSGPAVVVPGGDAVRVAGFRRLEHRAIVGESGGIIRRAEHVPLRTTAENNRQVKTD